jgi:hypothetical protein
VIEASFSLSFSRESRRSSKSSPSIGNRPENTIGLGSRYPSRASVEPWLAVVTVSPERASPTSLIPAIR